MIVCRADGPAIPRTQWFNFDRWTPKGRPALARRRMMKPVTHKIGAALKPTTGSGHGSGRTIASRLNVINASPVKTQVRSRMTYASGRKCSPTINPTTGPIRRELWKYPSTLTATPIAMPSTALQTPTRRMMREASTPATIGKEGGAEKHQITKTAEISAGTTHIQMGAPNPQSPAAAQMAANMLRMTTPIL